MFEQGGIIYRYRGAQHHHGHHDIDSAHPHGLGTADGQVAEDHVDPVFQRRLHVRFRRER